MFTTDTIVYLCEQNQNRYENGLALVNTGKFTFQESDWFDRVTIQGTSVNVAFGEFRGSSYNTSCIYQIKLFWVYLRPVPGEIS